MELRLPQLPFCSRWNLPGQVAHSGANRHQLPTLRLGFYLEPRPTCARKSKPHPNFIRRDGLRQSPICRSRSAQRRHRPRARTAPAARTPAASRARHRVCPPNSLGRQFHVRHASASSRPADMDSLDLGSVFSLSQSEEDSGIRCRAISLGTHFPAYVAPDRQTKLTMEDSSLGLIVESPSGKRLAYMPAVPQDQRRTVEGTRFRRRAALRWHLLERRRTDPDSRFRPNRPANGTRSCFFRRRKSQSVGATAPST